MSKRNQTRRPAKTANPCSGEMESAAATQRMAVAAMSWGFFPRLRSEATRMTKKAEPMLRVGV
jgi:hypothetical protein